jgi:hypothetical protein
MLKILSRFAAVAIVLASSNGVQAQTFADNFNRADSTDLGSNWTHITGTATRVISNSAGNVVGSNNLSLVTSANYSASYINTSVSADIFHSGVAGIGFVALAMGHNGGTAAGNGLYIKVQDNTGAGDFDAVGFYTGVGNGLTSVWTDPPVFFNLSSPFTSARMRIWASDASTINLGLDTNFDTIDDQVYTRHLNVGSMTFGTQAGLGIWGTNVTADNYTAIAAVPEPMTLSLIGMAAVGTGLLWWRRNARIQDTVVRRK